MIEAAKEAFKANPRMSMAEFAKDKEVAWSTVCNAIKIARGKSQRYVERPLLTQKTQEVRGLPCLKDQAPSFCYNVGCGSLNWRQDAPYMVQDQVQAHCS